MRILLCLRSIKLMESLETQLVANRHTVYSTEDATVAEGMLVVRPLIRAAVIDVELERISGLYVAGAVYTHQLSTQCQLLHPNPVYKDDLITDVIAAHHWNSFVSLHIGSSDPTPSILGFVAKMSCS